MPIEFFVSAMDRHEENTTFVILTNNVEYCKHHFNKYKNIYYAQEQDYIELKLMSKCQNHIMPVSTFSWWGVYPEIKMKIRKYMFLILNALFKIILIKKNFIIIFIKLYFKNLII